MAIASNRLRAIESRVLTPVSEESIERAAALLRAGECVAFPTETVYGLGADATNARAVARIFAIKARPSFDPLIVHIADPARVDDIAASWPAAARTLSQAFWPGPLTIVVAKRAIVPDIVTAGLPSVAVRMPDHRVALELIRRSGCPVAAPSANPFGYISPTRAEHVAAQLGGSIPLILDGGPCRVGLESTIVSFAAAAPTLLRTGAVSQEAIEALIGPIATSAADDPVQAPGQLPSHYAPRVPLTVVPSPAVVAPADRRGAALLSIDPIDDSADFARVIVLSTGGDLEEAAAQLFAAMRELDDAGVRHIYAVEPEERGIGRAIADRLRRAARRGPAPDVSPDH